MKRTLPKTRGKCPACGAWFTIESKQWLFDTSILSKEQKASAMEVSWLADRWKHVGVRPEDVTKATRSAQRSGKGGEAVRRSIEELAAGYIAGGDESVLNALGTEGVIRAAAGLGYVSNLNRTGPLGGLTLADAFAACSELKARYGRLPSAQDIAWGLFNLAALRTSADRYAHWEVLTSMALFVGSEGRKCSHIQRRAFQTSAKQYLNSSEWLRILPSHDCAAAQALEHCAWRVEDVVNHSPLPCEECTGESLSDEGHPWCRCDLVAVFDDELPKLRRMGFKPTE